MRALRRTGGDKMYEYAEIGPYSEYSPAQERAIRLRDWSGWRTVYIVKRAGQWWIIGYKPQATYQPSPQVNPITPASF